MIPRNPFAVVLGLTIPLLLLAAPHARSAGAAERRTAPPALPFAAPERAAYVARWSGLDAASAELRVAAGSTPKRLRLEVSGATSSLVRAFYDGSYRSTVECDARTLLPLRVVRETVEAGERTIETAIFHRQARVVETGDRKRPLDPSAHDPITLLYALRQARWGALGSIRRFAVSDLGQPWEVVVTVESRSGDGVVLRLDAASLEPGKRERLTTRVRIEQQGARRIMEMSAALPVGDVVLSLAP